MAINEKNVTVTQQLKDVAQFITVLLIFASLSKGPAVYHHPCCRYRPYKLWKLFADATLLLLTHGLWIIYIIWRLVRNDRCDCRRYRGRWY